MIIGQLVPEKIYLRFLPYMGMAAVLVMWLGPFENKLSFPCPMTLHMEFGFNRPCGLREDVWKHWHTYTHTDDRGLPISSPMSFKGQFWVIRRSQFVSDSQEFLHIDKIHKNKIHSYRKSRFEPRQAKTLLYTICEQQMHRSACADAQSKISAFVIRCLDSIIPILA